MPAAVSSLFKTGIALAGAGVIALSPVVPTQDVRVPTVNLPAIELSALPVPALGAIPYQVLVNQLGNALAIAPILIGSTKQCTTCLGPVPLVNTAVPFTGWGAIGIAAGLIASPIAFVTALGDGSVTKALGAALLAVQVPISNTLNFLLLADRIQYGGFALDAVLGRAFQAAKDSVDGLINIAAQALVTGPLTVLRGAVAGATTFAGTLASTGNVITAINAGRVPFESTVNLALTALTNEVQKNRSIVYNDLTSGPGVATSPIPTVAPPPVAAVSAAAVDAPAAPTAGGPVKTVVDSVKAVPGARSAAATAGSGDGSDVGSAVVDTPATARVDSTHARAGAADSKRRHRAQSAE